MATQGQGGTGGTRVAKASTMTSGPGAPAAKRTAAQRTNLDRVPPASAAQPARNDKASRRSAARSRPVMRGADEAHRPHHSPVESLLAAHPGAQADRPLAETTEAAVEALKPLAAAPAAADERPAVTGPSPRSVLDPATGLPPVQDIALGAATLVVERLWSAGTAALARGNEVVVWWLAFARALSPQVATAQVDARLLALGERGRRVRTERAEALASGFTDAVMNAATSDAVREMTVAAIEQATDDVLEVVLPAMLEAITERETQDKLDDLMAGLLLRQLPAALEKTIPQVMLRTATRPTAALMPFLGGVLPRG